MRLLLESVIIADRTRDQQDLGVRANSHQKLVVIRPLPSVLIQETAFWRRTGWKGGYDNNCFVRIYRMTAVQSDATSPWDNEVRVYTVQMVLGRFAGQRPALLYFLDELTHWLERSQFLLPAVAGPLDGTLVRRLLEGWKRVRGPDKFAWKNTT